MSQNGDTMTALPRPRSAAVFDGPDRAAARAYMKGIGFDDEALSRPTIGIANTWIEAMPCNYHLRGLAEHVKEGVRAAGGTPMEFNTIAISDGMTIGDVFEAIGAHAAGEMSDEDLHELEGCASPGAGACGGQFTANTMACAFEALGISPGGSAMVPAEDATKEEVAEHIGRLVMRVLEDDLRPSRVITRESLENAIACVCAAGGSTK